MNNKEQQRPKQRSGKRIQRIKDTRLLTHFNSPDQPIVAAGMSNNNNNADRNQQQPQPQPQPPQAAANYTNQPANQPAPLAGQNANLLAEHPLHHLSYRQQQQLHHHHIERKGGLERLTADLAFLDFNDTEANIFRPQGHRVHSRTNTSSGRTDRQQSLKNAARHLVADEQPEATNTGFEGRVAPDQQLQQSTANELQTIGPAYDDQMTIPFTTSKEQEQELAREAQETAEDTNLLKKYKICALLGVGNYARVYRSVPQNGREFAIKAINLSKTSDNYRIRFLPRELIILRKVNHYNICKIYEIHHIADRIFIVMQFCARGTIADLLHRLGCLSEPVSRFLFKPTVEAVVYLHSVEIAHRDIKLENILLDQDYNPKLTDFSYSTQLTPVDLNTKSRGKSLYLPRLPGFINNMSAGKHSNSPTRQYMRLNETFCGTLPYLSPEMIRQLPYESKKTDIWSLGICLFVMLNDRLPFPFNDVRQMLRKQLTKDYKFKVNWEFSDEARDAVAMMLEPEIASRLSASDLSHHPWMTCGPRERPPG